MNRITLATILTLVLTSSLGAQTLAPTGGAGNTGVAPPAVGPATTPRGADSGTRPAPSVPGNPSPAAVPGSTPGVNIGGTPTSGPPGTGGAAGGPSIGAQ